MFLFFIVLLITAWLSDDAYITLRTVDNFINGYGLTWNIGERVQTFTHPLWIYATHSISIIHERSLLHIYCSFKWQFRYSHFIILISRLSISSANSIIAGLILIFSKAFIDYSTCGLENPLSHLLIVLFYVIYFNYGWSKENILSYLLLFLAALNRLDIIIILQPSLFLYF